MRDRLAGPQPPKLIVVDPRRTVPAQHADLHLPIRSGTNLALLNALVHELIAGGAVDRGFADAHCVGYDELVATVRACTPEWAAEICGVPTNDIREAARILASSDRIPSTCLQGVYQSNQATASAVGVNNINLLRGAIGKPGGGILQTNGQPSAQNTRECGADGDFPDFRNWANESHVQELADPWNVDVDSIPHDGPPTHAMEIFALAEQGSIRFLKDLQTGDPFDADEYRALNPDGKAIIRATGYAPPSEPPSDEFPLQLIPAEPSSPSARCPRAR